MKLADLRRLAVKQQLRVLFQLHNGMECVVNEQGVAQIPSLRQAPDFNLEEELASAERFRLEPARADTRKGPRSRLVSRAELAAMAGAGTGAAAPDHEDE